MALSGVGGTPTVRKIRTIEWMGATFVVGLILCVAVYAVGAPAHRLAMALRASARWALLWFCLATYGGALTALFGSRFRPLAHARRDLGLAFVAAQSIHVVLAIWLLYSSLDPFPRLQLVVFSIGVFWTYVLAVISLNQTLNTWLGARRQRIVIRIGVEYIAFAYVFEFGGRILAGNRANAAHYLPLLAAALAGPLLRVGAAIRQGSDAESATRLLLG